MCFAFFSLGISPEESLILAPFPSVPALGIPFGASYRPPIVLSNRFSLRRAQRFPNAKDRHLQRSFSPTSRENPGKWGDPRHAGGNRYRRVATLRPIRPRR